MPDAAKKGQRQAAPPPGCPFRHVPGDRFEYLEYEVPVTLPGESVHGHVTSVTSDGGTHEVEVVKPTVGTRLRTRLLPLKLWSYESLYKPVKALVDLHAAAAEEAARLLAENGRLRAELERKAKK